jgi:hypothetical protein
MSIDITIIILLVGEKQELLDEVQSEWCKRQADFSSDDEDGFDESEECITKVSK